MMAEKSDCAGARYPNTAEFFCLEGKFKKNLFTHVILFSKSLQSTEIQFMTPKHNIKCWIFGIMSLKISKTYPNGHIKPPMIS